MCLLDTTDGALMMTLYTSTALAHDQIAILYYSIVLTVITIFAALAIGIIQLLSLIANVAPHTSGPFWDGVAAAGNHYDVIGGGICGSFIFFGGLSVLVYGPWRRRVDRKRQRIAAVEDSGYHDDTETVGVDGVGSVEIVDIEGIEYRPSDLPSKIAKSAVIESPGEST